MKQLSLCLACLFALLAPAFLAAEQPPAPASSEALLAAIFSADPDAASPALPDTVPQPELMAGGCADYCRVNGPACTAAGGRCTRICILEPDGSCTYTCGCI